MSRRPRRISMTPMTQLWKEGQDLACKRGRLLGRNEIRNLLGQETVHFAVANVGHELMWIPPVDAFTFWKEEVIPHLAEPDDEISLEDFPGAYAFFASEWTGESWGAIVLLEMHH